jgi:Golgi phosphoprotein 3 (GPP34)
MPGSDLLLADEFFLTAHDEDGKALLTERVLGLGLAAAVLGELILPHRLTIQNGLLRVVDRRPMDEPLGAWVLAQLLRDSGHANVRDWMSYLAKTAQDTVGRRLVHHGHVRRLERQRLLRGTVVRYQPVNIDQATWPRARLHHDLTGRAALPDHDVVLAGLILATGLDQHVWWNLDHTGRQHLIHLTRRVSPALRDLLAKAEAAVGEAVLSGRA